RGETPLILAATQSQTDGEQMRLQLGANVNARTKRGRTALMQAIDGPKQFDNKNHIVYSPAIAKLLIAAGADVNARDASGNTALSLATKRGYTDMVAILKAAVGQAPDPQASPTFHANVALVHVDAEVTDRDGRIVAGLSKPDFRVFDDGQEQHITGFSADLEPLDLILLFDISGSMRAVVQRVADAARDGLAELRPGDRVSVMV